MDVKQLSPRLSVSPQIAAADVATLAAQGFKSIIVNRPDGEGADQPNFAEIKAAADTVGLATVYAPIASGIAPSSDSVAAFARAMAELPGPVLAYCRSGARSTLLFKLASDGQTPARAAAHDIVIVGGGTAGIAVAASLLARRSNLDIAIIEPADEHFYQPGWTMVGGGVFDVASTRRAEADLIPAGVKRIKAAVASFDPADHSVILADGGKIAYKKLIVAPGLTLNWSAIEGLEESLGQNGVTSNYRYDLAPYTWDLVQKFKGGKALFTQPGMPIKCAGAPQKAIYLSCDHWLRQGDLKNIAVEFLNAGPVLFGVPDYVPALMEYIRKYNVALSFGHNLFKIDGPAKTAWFKRANADGSSEIVERKFDMIHVVPPQIAPDFIRSSPLANAGGWVDVDPATLRHKSLADIYSLGDAMGATNAKTMAAARKQAPVVAENVLKDMALGVGKADAIYDGYGSCPLTVERGKIVLAEFGYGGKRNPSFPKWLIDDLKPSRAAWALKAHLLPSVYWQGMLKGREWMAKPSFAK